MFGISLPELLVVLGIALLVFGPDKLPQIASQLGKMSFQLKKTSDAFRREFFNSVYKPLEEEKLLTRIDSVPTPTEKALDIKDIEITKKAEADDKV